MNDKLDIIESRGLLSEAQARRFIDHTLTMSASLRAEEDFILSVRVEILMWYQRPFARWLVRPERCWLSRMQPSTGRMTFSRSVDP